MKRKSKYSAVSLIKKTNESLTFLPDVRKPLIKSGRKIRVHDLIRGPLDFDAPVAEQECAEKIENRIFRLPRRKDPMRAVHYGGDDQAASSLDRKGSMVSSITG